MEQFEQTYREILTEVQNKLPNCRIILLEPFLIPSDPEKERWRVDLDPKIEAVRRLSRKFHTEFIPLDGLYQEQCAQNNPTEFSADGVHPSDKGHAFLAKEWIKRVL